MAAALETLLQDWRERLRAWSADGSLASAARHALELEGEQPLLDELVAKWADGDFSALPPITLLPASSMPGAAGAYAISTGTIYLNQDWLETATDDRVIAVLTEELGHYLDALINREDTYGDEGKAFTARLAISQSQAVSTNHETPESDFACIRVADSWITAEASRSSMGILQAGGGGRDYAYSIATRDGASFIITGYFYSTAEFQNESLRSSGDADVFTAKIDSGGNLSWTRQGGGESTDWGTSVAVDDDDSILIAGSFRGTAEFGETTLKSSGSSDIFVAKLDEFGDYVWATKAGGLGADQATSITLLNDGSLAITGYFQKTADFGFSSISTNSDYGAFVTRLDSEGNYIWTSQIAKGGILAPKGIASLTDQSLITTGLFRGSANFGGTMLTSSHGTNDIYITKIDSSGNIRWAIQAGEGGSDSGESITIMPDDRFIVAGGTSGKVYAAMFDVDGTEIWQASLGGGTGTGVAGFDDGTSVVTGIFSGSSELGKETLISEGGTDIFVAKLNTEGNILWTASAGGNGADVAFDIATSNDGSSVVTGYFSGTAEFGEQILTSKGAQDIFVARIDSEGKWISAEFVDTEPPERPRIINIVDSGESNSSKSEILINDATPTFTGMAEPGSTINLLMDGVLYPANTAVTTADPVTGEWSYTIPAEHAATEDITSSLTVTATDGAGNTSEPSDPLVITIDLMPPVFASGSFATVVDENSGAGQVVYTAHATDTHAVQYAFKTDNNDDADLFAVDASTGDITLTIDPDYETQASYAFTVVATDAAGNSTEQAVTLAINDLDDTAPLRPSVIDLDTASDTGASNSDNLTTNPTPTFTGTAEPGSTINPS